MKRLLHVLIAFCIVLNLVGCDALQRKFTRKKKATVKMPRIYQVKKYEKRPSPELYKKHYAYWESWHSELIKVLGKNHKKDKKCIEEIVGNLTDMQNILIPEKGDILKAHIERLARVRDTIFREEMSTANRSYVLMTLEREDRFIKREFCYNKVKNYFKKSFDDDDQTTK